MLQRREEGETEKKGQRCQVMGKAFSLKGRMEKWWDYLKYHLKYYLKYLLVFPIFPFVLHYHTFSGEVPDSVNQNKGITMEGKTEWFFALLILNLMHLCTYEYFRNLFQYFQLFLQSSSAVSTLSQVGTFLNLGESALRCNIFYATDQVNIF